MPPMSESPDKRKPWPVALLAAAASLLVGLVGGFIYGWLLGRGEFEGIVQIGFSVAGLGIGFAVALALVVFSYLRGEFR